jgi:very-short-patch-repair endonuclease
MTPEDEYFEETLRAHAEHRQFLAREDWNEKKGLCESPIEQRLLAAMMSCPYLLDGYSWASIGSREQIEGYESRETLIVPQLELGRYRLDFGVVWYRPKAGLITVAVECDGHAFHERTKEQAARDKSRDRSLLAMGWPVMRFTGSEIYADADACANDVADAIFETWVRRVRPDMRGPV